MFAKSCKLLTILLIVLSISFVKLVVSVDNNNNNINNSSTNADEVEREELEYSTSERGVNETTGADSDDYVNIDEPNNESNSKSRNSTDDYDDEEGEARDADDNAECGEPKQTFLDKWKVLYEQGKDVPVRKLVAHINDTTQVLKTFKENLGILFRPSDNSNEKFKALEFFTEIDLGLSNPCLTAFTRVMMAMAAGEIWALKFLDSMGRPLTSGFAEGVQSNFGEYTECLNIESPYSANRDTIKGQYCLMKAIIPFPTIKSFDASETVVDKSLYSGLLNHYNLTKLSTVRSFVEAMNLSNGTIYRLGVCIPAVCSAYEFEYLLNKLLFPVTRIPLEVGPQCHVKDQTKSLDKFQIISISILSISTLLIVLSTSYEIFAEYQQDQLALKINTDNKPEEKTKLNITCSKYNDLLTSFSIIRNTKTLFAKNTKFAALDTIRLLFIINVHAGHAFTYTTSLGIIGLKKIFSEVMFKVYEDNEYVFVRNPLIIDAFFTLSGFLLSFAVLRKLDKSKGRFNYFEFVIQRWIRFFILMFGAILFFYLFPLFGDGPIWDIGVGWVTPGCQNPSNLLKMLFFVHNFRDDLKEQLTIANSKCNPPTWFLSSLLQLTIIGPIFIIIYYRKRLYGLIAIIAAILLSLFASIAPQLLFNLKPYLQIWDLESVVFSVSRSYTWWHFTPNNYGTGFFIGILYAYAMRRTELTISRKKSALFWILSLIVCLSVYFWHNSFWRLDESAPLISVLLWHSLGKLCFCVGIGWIYFACCTGRGGYLNEALAWHGFQPIARLSFGIYILHYLVVMHRIFSSQYTYVMTDKYMFEHLVIDLIYDIILAFIFYLLIESPFFNIYLHFMSSPKSPESEQTVYGVSDQLNNNWNTNCDKQSNNDLKNTINNNNYNNNISVIDMNFRYISQTKL